MMKLQFHQVPNLHIVRPQIVLPNARPLLAQALDMKGNSFVEAHMGPAVCNGMEMPCNHASNCLTLLG